MNSKLSKGRYFSGLLCEKRLWLDVHQPHLATPASAFQRYLVKQGIEVGRFARRHFPDGELITIDRHNLQQAIADTQLAMQKSVTTLFEAAFEADGLLIIADILTRNSRGWKLIEVKSSTRVKDDFIMDVAVQRYVMRRSGVDLTGAEVMVVNTNSVFPELDDFFRTEDVWEKTDLMLDGISAQLSAFKKLLRFTNVPEVAIGDHCKNPFECPYKNLCWDHTKDRAMVFDIPRLSADKKETLRTQNILFLDDLPQDFPLTEAQQAHVNRVSNGSHEIKSVEIQDKLAELEYPLHFLDFESYAPAIPRFDGMRPYEQLPFQFSCHKLEQDGELTHQSYLHLDDNDPRPPLAEALLNAIGVSGSIIAYGAAFERGVLSKLAGGFPGQAKRLNAMVDRVWDQIEIFTHHFKHAAFGKSTSLKSVLPVLVPQLSYDALNIRNGAEAQTVWVSMLSSEDGSSKEKMIEDLNAYCHLDTLAMVEIHRALKQYLSE